VRREGKRGRAHVECIGELGAAGEKPWATNLEKSRAAAGGELVKGAASSVQLGSIACS